MSDHVNKMFKLDKASPVRVPHMLGASWVSNQRI
jgi:hypothetical protein